MNHGSLMLPGIPMPIGVLAGGGSPQPIPFRQFGNNVAIPQQVDASKTWSKGDKPIFVPSTYSGVIEIRYPNWWCSSNTTGPNGGATEQGSGATATGTFQITYTDKDTGLPVTVPMLDAQGNSTVSASSGDDFVLFATVNVPAGSKIVTRHRINFPSGILYTLFVSDTANGELLEFGTSAPAALSVTPADTFPGTSYGPYMVRARHSGLVAAIIDDSTGRGIKERPNTAKGDVGEFARLFGQAGISYVNLSAPGEKAKEFVTGVNSVRRRAAVALAGADFVADGLGKNDFIGGDAAATILANRKAIINSLARPKPAILKTISPYTVNNYTTPSANESQRTALNALVVAEPVFFDAAKVMEDASIPGAWGSYYAVGNDEPNPGALHASNIGSQWSADQGQLFGVTLANHGIAARSMGALMTMPSNPVQANYIGQQDVSNAYWDKGSPARITASAITVRDLSKLRETSQNSQHSFFNASAIVRASAAKTFIAFLDAEPVNASDFMRLTIFDGAFAGRAECYFDMTTKAVTFATQDGTQFTGAIGRVTAIPGTTMYRYEIEFGAIAGNANFYYIAYMQPDVGTGTYVGSTANGWNIGRMWLYNKNAAAGGL